MDIQKWIKRNPTESVLFGGAVLLLLLNMGGIKNSLAEQEISRQSVAVNNRELQQFQIDADKQKKLANIANNRFDTGCELLIALDKPDHYKALADGSPVLDGAYLDKYRGIPENAIPKTAFLPAGKTVCDSYGTTGVLVDEPHPERGGESIAVIRQLATTEDRERIRKAMERVHAKWTAGAN